MGFYINPPDMTKEEFLEKYGEKLKEPPTLHRSAGKLAVCLIHNVQLGFTAAGICYSSQELDVFRSPDRRPKKWYMVKEEHLERYLPEYVRGL